MTRDEIEATCKEIAAYRFREDVEPNLPQRRMSMTSSKHRATLKEVAAWWAAVAVVAALMIGGWAVMAYSATTHTLEKAFNVHPGMKVSRDVPGLGNRLFTYKRIEARGNGEYAIVFTMKRW